MYKRQPLEIVGIHVSVYATTRKPNLEKLPRIAASGKIAPGNRQVYFSKTGGWINAQVYRRDTLAVGSRISGPAVIEEYGATTVIEPGDELVVGKFGEIQVMVGD